MMLSVCFVLFVSFGFIQTIPISYQDPYTTNENYNDYNNIVRIARNLILNPGSESLLPLGDTGHIEDPRLYQNKDFIRLPAIPSGEFIVMPQTPYIDDRNAIMPYGLNMNNLQSWRNQYLRTPYDEQNMYDAGSMNVDISPYEVDLYPRVHTSISSALNPLPAVHTLPPVYSTHIHESVPTLNERGDYDIDVLNPENSELSVPILRISRSRTDDFMDELRHEAIMSNLLPTMPVPYVRGAEGPYQVPQQQYPNPMMAVYPTEASKGCALPLLLNCSPDVIRGTVAGSYPDHMQSGLSEAVYRQHSPDNDNLERRDINNVSKYS